MKRTAFPTIFAIAALSTAAIAGNIHGKVSGVSGESVVYVEAIPGKTFPAPTQHTTIDQKGLMFVPHIVAVEQGTTIEFLNSDSVAASNSTTLAWCRCFAMFTPRCLPTSLCLRRLTLP